MNAYRRFLVLGLALAFALGTSCTSGENPLETQPDGDVPTLDGEYGPIGDNGDAPTGDGGDEPTGDGGDEPTGDDGDAPTGGDGDGGDGDGDDGDRDDGDEPWQLGLLSCAPQPYAATTRVIGPKGGQINVGDHNLRILEFALSEEVAITMEQIEGTINSVRLSPEGLHFALPTVLTLSYKNCPPIRHSKRIAYTDESLNILEWLPSLDLNRSSQVKGLIYHFSRYAVAY